MAEEIPPTETPPPDVPPDQPPGQPSNPEEVSTWQMSSTVTADGKFDGYWRLKLIS